MARDLSREIEGIERLIQGGDFRAARLGLAQLGRLRRVDRRFWAPIARLCRRANQFDQAVHWLQRAVRPPMERGQQLASAAEKAEYAAALGSLGSVREARELLESVDPEQYPGQLLFLSFVHFEEYRHDEAIPLLERYVGMGLPSQQLLAGKTYLAGAWIESRGEIRRALALLNEVLADRRLAGLRFVRFAAEILKVNALACEGRAAAARECLEGLRRDWKEPAEYRSLIEMWETAIAATVSGSTVPWERVDRERSSLFGTGLWEKAREMDLFVAERLGNRRLLEYLYFGTPYPRFRERVAKLLAAAGAGPAEEFRWRLPGPKRERRGSVVIDAIDGGDPGSPHRSLLREGQLSQRLLQALSRDFYRPQSLVQLSEEMYPNQYYLPDSSPGRLHQVMRQFRSWVRGNRLPLRISEGRGLYRLEAEASCVIRVRREQPTEGAPGRRVWEESPRTYQIARKLREAYGRNAFSSAEACRTLRISSRSSSRLLASGVDYGVLARSGAGRATRYRVVEGPEGLTDTVARGRGSGIL